jgi:hypothetical protein
MKTEMPVEQLLRWRAAYAGAEAPPAPRGAHLLELVRPWWETWPEQFQSLVDRIQRIQMAYGHAMAEGKPSGAGYSVPTMLVHDGKDLEISARMLYINVRADRLRLRFQLDGSPANPEKALEVTFVATQTGQPLLCAQAVVSVDSEYRMDTQISMELARDWESLKVTDRMPFRLILRGSLPGS